MEQNCVENVMAGVSRVVYTKLTFVKIIHSVLDEVWTDSVLSYFGAGSDFI